MSNVNYPLYPFVKDGGNAYYTRNKIYKFIFDRKEAGVKPNELWKSEMWKSLRKTRQWGHKCLNVLEKQNLIFEYNHKYYPVNSDLNNIYWFATKMDYLSPVLARSLRTDDDDGDQPSPDSSYYATPIGVLERKTRGPSPSPKFCQTKFTSQSSNEKCIFEFANRLGAYITYIFIESMKLSLSQVHINNNKKDINEKSEMLIHTAINLRHWYENFCDLTDIIGPDKLPLAKGSLRHREQKDMDNRLYHQELNYEGLQKLRRTFENIYPGIYNGLEASWRKVVEDSIYTEQYYASTIKRECKHRIEETRIYKYPRKCYSCRNCQSLSHDKSFSKPTAENLPLELRVSQYLRDQLLAQAFL